MDDELAEVVRLELLLLEPAVRNDPARVLALLHPDFREHGASGRVWDRGNVAESTAGTLQAVQADDVRAARLAPDVVLVTYRSRTPERTALRSSLWRREGGRWLMAFHQGTPVPPDDPAAATP